MATAQTFGIWFFYGALVLAVLSILLALSRRRRRRRLLLLRDHPQKGPVELEEKPRDSKERAA